MTNKDPFPLCTAAGLTLFRYGGCGEHTVSASDVERMLAEAPVVRAEKWDGGAGLGIGWVAEQEGLEVHSKRTHTACLVCIQPLKPADTAESLLRELVDKINHMNGDACPWADALKRAQALLKG